MTLYCVFSHSAVSSFLWPNGLWAAVFSVCEIFQARILEWVAMPRFRRSSQPRDRNCISCVSCIAGGFLLQNHQGSLSYLVLYNKSPQKLATVLEWSFGYWGKGGRDREFGKVVYTRLYLKWITNKDLLYITWNSAQCYVAAWMGGGVWGRMDTCICMAEFSVVHLKLLHHS